MRDAHDERAVATPRKTPERENRQMTYTEARRRAAAIGYTIRKTDDGELRVTRKGSDNERAAYYTNDADDALATAIAERDRTEMQRREMAQQIEALRMKKDRAAAKYGRDDERVTRLNDRINALCAKCYAGRTIDLEALLTSSEGEDEA